MEKRENNRPGFSDGDVLDVIFGEFAAETDRTMPKVAPESAYLEPEKFWLLDCVLISL